MPLKVLLRFRTKEEIELAQLKPRVAHGLVFSLFKGNPEVGNLLHAGTVKPFSISINSHFRYPNRRVTRFGIVFNLLDNTLYPKISRYLFFPENNEFEVGGVEAELVGVKPIEVRTYEDILESSPDSRDLLLDFLSPTTFKRENFDYPLPEPRLVFSGLLRKWNRFSPVKIERGLLKELTERLTVSGCWIKTKKSEIMEGAKLTGFFGRVFFYAFSKNPSVLKALNALADFAQFAGVGRKTTMGFGSVRFVREAEED